MTHLIEIMQLDSPPDSELHLGVATALDFGHDIVNRDAAEPTFPVTGIVAISRPIQPKKTGEAV